MPAEHEGELGFGGVWTWTAIDADSKLVPAWLVGERPCADAIAFIDDLAGAADHEGPTDHRQLLAPPRGH